MVPWMTGRNMGIGPRIEQPLLLLLLLLLLRRE